MHAHSIAWNGNSGARVVRRAEAHQGAVLGAQGDVEVDVAVDGYGFCAFEDALERARDGRERGHA